MSKKALLVVDVQEALVAENPYRRQELIAAIKRLKAACAQAGVEVLYVRHNEEEGELKPDSPGWAIYHELAPQAGERVVDKWFNSAFHKTELAAYLEEQGITELILTGMQTEFCIDATCKSAFDLGYRLTIPEEANSTFDNAYLPADKLHEFYNRGIWQGRFAEVMSLGDCLARLAE
ncbi:cysteine hydrolase family protein [Gorillibacterium sp. sgz500922]|uniref:cysteine hydrolase family protein n=1 Tax=Gorillibacterium sp. sgz500922 TaxID=3446694 RepID=UPI003F664BDB